MSRVRVPSLTPKVRGSFRLLAVCFAEKVATLLQPRVSSDRCLVAVRCRRSEPPLVVREIDLVKNLADQLDHSCRLLGGHGRDEITVLSQLLRQRQLELSTARPTTAAASHFISFETPRHPTEHTLVQAYLASAACIRSFRSARADYRAGTVAVMFGVRATPSRSCHRHHVIRR